MAKKPKRMDLPERITVSRNVLVTASDFDAFEMNIIAILLFILRPFMYLADKSLTPESSSCVSLFSPDDMLNARSLLSGSTNSG